MTDLEARTAARLTEAGDKLSETGKHILDGGGTYTDGLVALHIPRAMLDEVMQFIRTKYGVRCHSSRYEVTK